MILDVPPKRHFLRSVFDVRARRRAELLVARFAITFSTLTYDIYWETDRCNAQAFLGHGTRHVRLYGGLARHKLVSVAGLSIALAHETGHHLGGPPFHRQYPWLSSEERADTWATSEGLALVFGRQRAAVYAVRGRQELALIFATFGL